MGIPRQKQVVSESRIPFVKPGIGRDERLLFSFAAIQKNDFFNLDGTCQNWAADLFDSLQKASQIKLTDVYAGKYSGKTSPFRIHSHAGIGKTCAIPDGVDIEDMWQIRISQSKGGIHGIFSENVFYIIWFDPQHNLYPDKKHGGVKKIIPPSTCCKERESEVLLLKEEILELKEEIKVANDLIGL